MNALFHDLLDGGVAEVRRREAQYFSRFPLAFPATEQRIERYRSHRLFRNYTPAQLDEAAVATISHCADRGAKIADEAKEPDPVALTLLDSGMDAFAAMHGQLSLKPPPCAIPPVSDVLAADYQEKCTGSGRRYFVRRQGGRPLLLINALGIPLTVWSRLLADPAHEFRIIVVENRCSDLIAGGMQSDVDLTRHADDIAAVLDHEQAGTIDVLAWCNGGRIAIDLLRRHNPPVRSVVLLSTTLRGVMGVERYPSPFEDNLQEVFKTITANPAVAQPLAKMLRRYAKSPDWDAIGDDFSGRAAALFRLPAQESATALLSPMSSGQFLMNYARRTTADEAYPIDVALMQLAGRQLPILLITGDHDNVVSNQAICAALAKFLGKAMHANVSGAGHYVHDLQYPYFLWLVRAFTENATLSADAARVSTRELAA